jgi:hypothetical protein
MFPVHNPTIRSAQTCTTIPRLVYLSPRLRFRLLPSPTDILQFWAVDSGCSSHLTAFRHGFVSLGPTSGSTHVGGVAVNVMGIGQIRLAIPIHRTIHGLYSSELPSPSTQHIGRLLGVSWMQSHIGCDFLFPTNYNVGLVLGST